MPALFASIHVFSAAPQGKAWKAGTSPAMTVLIDRARYLHEPSLGRFLQT
jgi:hypothetical protein